MQAALVESKLALPVSPSPAERLWLAGWPATLWPHLPASLMNLFVLSVPRGTLRGSWGRGGAILDKGTDLLPLLQFLAGPCPGFPWDAWMNIMRR